jgi:hypothetical protein
MKSLCLYILSILLLFLRCSTSIVSGGGETTNGVITGKIVYENGLAASNTIVSLIKSAYNPLKDGAIPGALIDTTDINGAYSMGNVLYGSYNIQALNITKRTSALTTGVIVNSENVFVPDDTLAIPGSLQIFLPDTIDTVNGYVYIAGTSLFKKLTESSTGADGRFITLDSVPAVTIPSLQYGKTNNPADPVRITDTVVVFSNDTAKTEAFVYWALYVKENSGLVSNIINDILIASNKAIWIATDKGVSVFDGTVWATYTSINSKLPNDTVISLLQHTDGRIWFATLGGAAVYNGADWTTYTMQNSGLPTNVILEITEDKNGEVWFGSDSGVLRYNGTTWFLYNKANTNLPADFIENIKIDRNNLVWIATGKGAALFDRSIWTVYTTQNSGLLSNNVLCIGVTKQNTLWFGHEQGISKYSGTDWTTYNGTDSPILASPVRVIQEIDKDIWVGTDRGITRFNGTNWSDLNGPKYPLLKNKSTYMITEDTSGNKWIGTFESGVICFGPTVK